MNLLSNDPTGRQIAFNQAVSIIYANLPKPSAIMVPCLTGFDLFVQYMPHVLSIHETYLQYESDLKPTVELAEMISNISAYGAGVIWTTGGLINRQQGHAMTWRVLELREQHMECCTRERCSVEEQNLLSNAYNDWALQLINEGRYREAKPFSEKSLEIKYRLLDSEKDQFQFFISKILLAFVLLSEGDVEGAPGMAQEAFEHIEKEKGSDDPFTLHYKFHVGNAWASVGEYRKALEVHRASVEARTALFGQANHDTLNGHFAIAHCLYRLGEFTDARMHVDKCLKQQRAANWGSEHLLRAKYLQSLIMQKLKDTGKNWKAEEKSTITERNDLLVEHGRGKWADPEGTNEFVYFDYLVNVHAGRTSFVQLEDCGEGRPGSSGFRQVGNKL
ncbi:hypothetical protein QQX98_007095 [Neonectria punicea]|uniref:Uncharacterized protein n=1 Tax=Neonectria punicea TaxID=979145 RepID=A0ABR1GZE6_9HYPO